MNTLRIFVFGSNLLFSGLIFATNNSALLGIDDIVTQDDIAKDTQLVENNPTLSKEEIINQNKNWIPDGFEELLEPQTTEVDIYYGGYFLTSTIADFTDTLITFKDAVSIVDKIPDMINSNAIILRLEQGLRTNRQLICRISTQINCGRLNTDDVAVIFDESNFHVDLFIGPQNLGIKDSVTNRYLPPSDGQQLSYLHGLQAFINGRDTEVSNYNISNSVFLSYKENHLNISSNILDDSRLEIDTLSLRRQFNGKDISLGLSYPNSSNLFFLRERQAVGFSYESSLLTRKDLDSSMGNEIQIFLPNRSRVDIFRDGRIISTKYYDLGNQILDTRYMPEGSYDIEIKITDASGSVSTETRFFSKTPRLPPKDQDLYFFRIGRNVQYLPDQNFIPDFVSPIYVKAGYSKRITDTLGGTIGMSASGENQFFESALYKQGRNYEIQGNFAVESTGSYALQIRNRLSFMGLVLSNDIRKTWANSEPDSIYTELGRNGFQASLRMSAVTSYGLFSLFGRYNHFNNKDKIKSYGLRWSMPRASFLPGMPFLNFEVSKNDNDLFMYLSARFNFSQDSLSANIDPTLAYTDISNKKTSRIQGRMSADWNAMDSPESHMQLGINASNEQSGQRVGAQLYARSNIGRMDLQSNYNSNIGELEYAGRFSSNISSSDGQIKIGGQNRAQSGFIIDVKGIVEEETRFEVRINNRSRTIIDSGKSVFIPLPPYETYTVELLALDGKLVTLEGGRQKRTLYLGNVISLEWAVKKIIIIFGKATDEAGIPIPNALIKNVNGLALTEEDGYFQAEMEVGQKQLTLQKKGKNCVINLPAYTDENEIIDFDELICIN
jgi:Mat/Ecp fimbriae outer membrane usher protein